MRGKVLEPGKELRFTRSGQAVACFVVGSIGLGAVLVMAFTIYDRELLSCIWQWLAMMVVGVSGLAMMFGGVWMTRHAYLILSPVGVEIFPLFFPSKGFTVVMWGEIEGWDMDRERQELRLHYRRDKSAGVVITMKPIPKDRRLLLLKALEGRLGGPC